MWGLIFLIPAVLEILGVILFLPIGGVIMLIDSLIEMDITGIIFGILLLGAAMFTTVPLLGGILGLF